MAGRAERGTVWCTQDTAVDDGSAGIIIRGIIQDEGSCSAFDQTTVAGDQSVHGQNVGVRSQRVRQRIERIIGVIDLKCHLAGKKVELARGGKSSLHRTVRYAVDAVFYLQGRVTIEK